MKIETFFDKDTFTLTYLVFDEKTKDSFIIDPVLDYDARASKIATIQVDLIEDYINKYQLKLHYCLETHAHADHLSGAPELKKRFPNSKIGINKNITLVQDVFKDVFNFQDLKTDGSQFDLLFDNNDIIQAGSLIIKAISTPGHTPACSSFLIDDVLFSGDSLFMPDYGTGRCDFPAGSSADLFNSVHEKLYSLADNTRVFVGHDYQPRGRELKWETTIGESKENNIQLKASTTKDEYVKMRDERDATLAAPRLLLQSVQVNIKAGHLPEKESNGVKYLKIPIQ